MEYVEVIPHDYEENKIHVENLERELLRL